MTAPFDSTAFATYALCSSLIVILLVVLAARTAGARAKVKVFLNPEDKTLDATAVLAEVEHAAVQRAKRAHLNLLENAVPFFVIGLLYAATNPSPAVARGFYFTFVGARVLHAIFYLGAKQPFRTMSFAVGTLALVGMTVQVIRAAL